jgi:hypothetical protein
MQPFGVEAVIRGIYDHLGGGLFLKNKNKTYVNTGWNESVNGSYPRDLYIPQSVSLQSPLVRRSSFADRPEFTIF